VTRFADVASIPPFVVNISDRRYHMSSLTTEHLVRKQILPALIVLAGLLAASANGQSTFTFNNNAGGQIWNLDSNWDQLTLPTATSYAYRNAGSFGPDSEFMYLTAGSLSLNASVGTFVVTAPQDDFFRSLRASNGQNLSSVLTFGTAQAGGAFVVAPDSGGNVLSVGAASNDGTLTFNVPRSLGFEVGGDVSLRVSSVITGSGSVSYGQIAGQALESTYILDKYDDTNNTLYPKFSSYSGGTRIGPNVTVELWVPSVQNAGTTTVQTGPLGTATCTLNGGTLSLRDTRNSGSFVLGNALSVTANSTLAGHVESEFLGAVRTGQSGGHRLQIRLKDQLTFNNAGWSGADTGTITFFEVFEDPPVVVRVNSGTSSYGGYWGEPATGTLQGVLHKDGDGTYEARRYTVGRLSILDDSAGTASISTLRVLYSGTDLSGSTDSTSRVNTLELSGGITPTVKFDLTNNDLIIDYDGASPLGTIDYNNGTASGHAAQLKAAFAGGAWTGNGITSTQANATNYALGYAEASQALQLTGDATATFSGQTVDATSALIKFTYYGDTDLSGVTDIGDFGRQAQNYNQPGLWYQGDCNYDGLVDIADYSLLAANFNGSMLRGSGVSGLGELYVAMLDWPQIYWEARDRADIWWRFEPFESMGLGAIPPRPVGFRPGAPAVPEPGGVLAAVTLLLAGARRRR
jgi:hypothetical protein